MVFEIFVLLPYSMCYTPLGIASAFNYVIGYTKDLIQSAGVGHLLSNWMAETFRTEAGFNEFCKELKVITSFGGRFTVYDREHIRQIEPDWSPFIVKLF